MIDTRCCIDDVSLLHGRVGRNPRDLLDLSFSQQSRSCFGVRMMELSGTDVSGFETSHIWPQATYNHRRICNYLLSTVALIVDIVLLMLALGIVNWLQRWDASFNPGEIAIGGGAAILASCVGLSCCGAYRIKRPSDRTQLGLLFGVICIGAVVFSLFLEILSATLADKQGAIGIRVSAWAGFALLFLSGAHGLSTYLFSSWNLPDALRRRVALVGAAEFGAVFIERAANDPDSDIKIVGLYYDSWPGTDAGSSCEHPRGDLRDLVARCQRDEIDAVVLAVPLMDTARIDRIRYALRDVITDVYVAADLVGLRFGVADLQAVGRSPVVSLRRRPLDEWEQLQKAIFDRLLGGMLLLSVSPFLLLIGVIIRVDSRGPVLFCQPRLGFNNRTFNLYKFRTMYDHNDLASLNGSRQAQRGDARITRVGKWLRKYSIDELPQLLNVMKGEMSLVGPRPHPLNTMVGNQLFQEVVHNYASRHRVLPGITGWAQINGWRGETVFAEQIEQRVTHDLYYIDNWSLAFDVRILFLTVIRETLSRKAF
jgi:Undecaprenyl-phosphate glucose phosphotransferase